METSLNSHNVTVTPPPPPSLRCETVPPGAAFSREWRSLENEPAFLSLQSLGENTGGWSASFPQPFRENIGKRKTHTSSTAHHDKMQCKASEIEKAKLHTEPLLEGKWRREAWAVVVEHRVRELGGFSWQGVDLG